MHWTLMEEKLPIEEPWSLKGYATIKEPGSPPRTEYGYFHSGRNVYSWEKNPKPYMVKAKYHWESHLPISKYDVVFCVETSKDEEGIHYYVYPQPWIVAWMPEIPPYMENFPDTFVVEVEGVKYHVEYPELEDRPEHRTMTEQEIFEATKYQDKVYKKRFMEVINRGSGYVSERT